MLALSDRITFVAKVVDGSRVSPRTVLAEVEGPARALLTAERTALNFLGRMSGIATLTRQFVDAISTTKAVILDTRKTAPGLRLTDKLAVRLGGGENHRTGLFDMVLIKDNHIDFAGSITAAVERVRASKTKLELEVETRSLDDVREALRLGVSRILLDNMSLETKREAVCLLVSKGQITALSNCKLTNLLVGAESVVAHISSRAFNHSPTA